MELLTGGRFPLVDVDAVDGQVVEFFWQHINDGKKGLARAAPVGVKLDQGVFVFFADQIGDVDFATGRFFVEDDGRWGLGGWFGDVEWGDFFAAGVESEQGDASEG